MIQPQVGAWQCQAEHEVQKLQEVIGYYRTADCGNHAPKAHATAAAAAYKQCAAKILCRPHPTKLVDHLLLATAWCQDNSKVLACIKTAMGELHASPALETATARQSNVTESAEQPGAFRIVLSYIALVNVYYYHPSPQYALKGHLC
jgi:hypothetical protein